MFSMWVPPIYTGYVKTGPLMFVQQGFLCRYIASNYNITRKAIKEGGLNTSSKIFGPLHARR